MNIESNTYPGNLYTGAKVGRAVDLRAMQARQDSAEVGRKRRKDLGALATHAHKTDGRLRVYTHLGGVNDADGVDLRLPSCRAGASC